MRDWEKNDTNSETGREMLAGRRAQICHTKLSMAGWHKLKHHELISKYLFSIPVLCSQYVRAWGRCRDETKCPSHGDLGLALSRWEESQLNRGGSYLQGFFSFPLSLSLSLSLSLPLSPPSLLILALFICYSNSASPLNKWITMPNRFSSQKVRRNMLF